MYQDIWVNGEIITQGERECETRYLAIKNELLKYNRPFSVLDIGAAQGYFTFRIAEDFPDSIVVAIEKDSTIVKYCKKNDLPNVVCLNHNLSYNDIFKISQCEFFDVVLCLNVLHHLDVDTTDILTILDCLDQLGDTVIIETPDLNEHNAVGECRGGQLIPEIFNQCRGRYTSILTCGSHVQDVDRELWLKNSNDIKYVKSKSFFDKTNDYRQELFTICVSPKTCTFVKGDSTRSYLPGINLRTYQCLSGAYPSRAVISDKVGSLLEGCPHGDIRSWNIILTNTAGNIDLVLIDIDDKQTGIYDSIISTQAIEQEILSGCPIDINTWQNIGKRQLAVVTPFRNCVHLLSRYFDQLYMLSQNLQMHVRLIAAEGDSTDNTRKKLIELSKQRNVDLQIIDVSHGKGPWESVEDLTRMQCMSDVMNAAMECVGDTDDVVMWTMSDIVYDDHICEIINKVYDSDPNNIYAPLTLAKNTNIFWDTWGYRDLNGNRFKSVPPYCKDLDNAIGYIPISSAGSCLIMSADIARVCRATDLEAVTFCRDAISRGHNVLVSTSHIVRHKSTADKKLLWYGDVLAPTGFTRMSSVLQELVFDGYEIHIVGINYFGEPHNLPYKIWPASISFRNDKGLKVLNGLLQHTKYDMFICCGDVWDANRCMEVVQSCNIPNTTIAWITVDTTNQQGGCLSKYNKLISCTEFGKMEISRILHSELSGSNNDDSSGSSNDDDSINTSTISSSDISIVELGCNIDIFKPIPQARELFLSSINPDFCDKFIVGAVAKNQWRKRLDLTIATFASFIKKSDADAILLLHTYCQTSMEAGQIDLYKIAKYYNIEDRLFVNLRVIGDVELSMMYNCFDVFISTSLGEGFCLPVLEAMACGVSCVVPDHTGYCWTGDHAARIPIITTDLVSPMNEPMYALGGVIDINKASDTLCEYYDNPSYRDEQSTRVRSFVKNKTWDKVSQTFLDTIKG